MFHGSPTNITQYMRHIEVVLMDVNVDMKCTESTPFEQTGMSSIHGLVIMDSSKFLPFPQSLTCSKLDNDVI